MINLAFAKGQTYIVAGLGKTGLSTVHSLRASGAHVIVYDDLSDISKLVAEGYHAYTDDLDWSLITALVLSPGIPHHYPKPHFLATQAKAHNIPIICDIDLLAQAFPSAKFYGITGTNGKSTTTALLYHQLKALNLNVYLGGNIGYPVLDFDVQGPDPIFVLELSSYQLERVPHLNVNTVIWLNISVDHVDRHGDMIGYVQAKQHIFAKCGHPQNIVIGIDDKYSQQCFEQLSHDHAKALQAIDTIRPELSQHPVLKGDHNYQNIMAVQAALSLNKLQFNMNAFAQFGGLPHRQEYCGNHHGVIYINDSKATNFESTQNLLRTYDQLHLILGGVAKADGIKGIEQYAHRIIICYLIGQAQHEFATYLEHHNIPYILCDFLDQAVQQAANHAKAGHTVALSPACASFDQFSNFEQRGDTFKLLVQKRAQ